MIMDTLRFDRERPVNASDILGLFARSKDPSLTADVYGWKHLENPHGIAATWTARERKGGRLVGSVSLLPRLRRFDKGSHRGGQLVDAMVDPDYRRRGVFTQILRNIVAQHREEGFDFMYLLPPARAMSRRAFRDLPPFVHVVTLKRYRRFWTGRTFATRILKSNLLARGMDPMVRWWFDARDRLAVEPVETQPSLWLDQERYGFVQDHDWLIWRTRAPGCGFTTMSWIGGGALLRVEGRIAMLYVLKLGPRPAGALRALLDHCERERLDALYFDAHVNPEVHALLIKSGFMAHANGGDHYIFGTYHRELQSGYEMATTTFMRADLDVP
jgi:GNAT superfamily N-acetyltransferase